MLGIPGYMFVFVRCDSDWDESVLLKLLIMSVFFNQQQIEDEIKLIA